MSPNAIAASQGDLLTSGKQKFINKIAFTAVIPAWSPAKFGHPTTAHFVRLVTDAPATRRHAYLECAARFNHLVTLDVVITLALVNSARKYLSSYYFALHVINFLPRARVHVAHYRGHTPVSLGVTSMPSRPATRRNSRMFRGLQRKAASRMLVSFRNKAESSVAPTTALTF